MDRILYIYYWLSSSYRYILLTSPFHEFLVLVSLLCLQPFPKTLFFTSLPPKGMKEKVPHNDLLFCCLAVLIYFFDHIKGNYHKQIMKYNIANGNHLIIMTIMNRKIRVLDHTQIHMTMSWKLAFCLQPVSDCCKQTFSQR